MIKLSELINRIESDCETDCFVDTSYRKNDVISIRLVENRTKSIFFDHKKVELTMTSPTTCRLEYEDLKDALSMPFETTPVYIIILAANQEDITIDFEL